MPNKAMRIGGRLRRMRQERRLTQAEMARELGISASYLTLLESNQRPVTVRVLLRLVDRFHVDLKDLTADTDQRLSVELTEAFSDPLSLMTHDPDHSGAEERFIVLGGSRRGRLLVVSYRERGPRTRLISARLATRSERARYEEDFS